MAKSIAVHTSRDFEGELSDLRRQLLEMGDRCERAVNLAFEAFLQGEADATDRLEPLDALIDADEIRIHALVMRILALRQPVAADLRFLAASLRLIVDLERIGDEAVNIAERAVVNDGVVIQLVERDLRFMAHDASGMLHAALDAFVRWDDVAAGRVLAYDANVDRRCASVISAMVAHMSSRPSDIRAGLRVIRVAKYLERIADHATNVAEGVVFIIRADDVRHRQWLCDADTQAFATAGRG